MSKNNGTNAYYVEALNNIADNVYDIEKTLRQGADGTNWTVADGVSNIHFELKELNMNMVNLINLLTEKLK